MGQARAKKGLRRRESPWRARWRQAWPDAVAFVFGIAVAAVFGWKTSELLWSLWLSATVVGFAFVLWAGLGMARVGSGDTPFEARPLGGFGVVLLVLEAVLGSLFTLLHFGAFQALHSIALNQYFPISAATVPPVEDPGMYWRLFQAFWYFLPAAFLAQRRSFAPWPRPGTEARFRKWANEATYKVYLTVIRLHVLLMLLVLTKPESLWVFSTIYGLYFFPWSLLKRPRASE